MKDPKKVLMDSGIARNFAVLALVAGLAAPAQARQDIVPGSRYTSARAAALGDAFLPLGDDGASAIFYNPADVGKVKQIQVEPLNLGFYANSNYLGQFSLANPTFYKVTSLSAYLPTLQANPGSPIGIGASLVPNVAVRGFAFGVLAQSQVYAQVNPDGTVRYRSLYQLVPGVATGVRLAGGIVRLGYSLQWVNQASGTQENVSAASELGYNQNLAQGSAFSHNFGLALTLPLRLLPSFNVVARNVLGARYTSRSIYSFTPTPSGVPADEPMTIDASFSIQPKMGAGAYFNLILVDRDATNVSGVSLMGRLALGIEFSFRDAFFLRGGWGSGYPNAGLGLKRQGGEFSLSWCSEEVGVSYQSVRDTRFMMQYQVRPR